MRLAGKWQKAILLEQIPEDTTFKDFLKTPSKHSIGNITLRRRTKQFLSWGDRVDAEDPLSDTEKTKSTEEEEDEEIPPYTQVDVFSDYIGSVAPPPKPASVRERKVTTDLPKFSRNHSDPAQWLEDMIEDCEDANKIGERKIRPIIRHMDAETRTRVNLSTFAKGGLLPGLTFEDFKNWWLMTFVESDKQDDAKTAAKRYNPVGRTVRKVLADLFQLFLRAGSLLSTKEACLIVRSKVPRDVLARIPITRGRDLKSLSKDILEAEHWLYPKRQRKIEKSEIDWTDIPNLDPRLTPKNTSPVKTCTYCNKKNHTVDECRKKIRDEKENQSSTDNNPKNDSTTETTPTKKNPNRHDKPCPICNKTGHSKWHCDKRKELFATALAEAIRGTTPTPDKGNETTETSSTSTPTDDLEQRLQYALSRCHFSAVRRVNFSSTKTKTTCINVNIPSVGLVNSGIDSWATDHFIHPDLVNRLGLLVKRCQEDFVTLNGTAQITHKLVHPFHFSYEGKEYQLDEVFVSEHTPRSLLIAFHYLEGQGWKLTPPQN